DYTDYAGLYILTERIEVGVDRLNIRKLSAKDTSGDALTGGYILKIDPADPDELAWTTPHGVTGNSSIVLVAPKAGDIVPEQLDYIQNFTRQMETALVRDQATGFAQRSYLDYIDRASWVDYHLLTVFTSNPDGLVRSTYFHKDRGGRLVAGPVWDYDRALGSFWDQRSRAPDDWFGLGSPDYWNTGWWGILARDPEFMQEWVDRWQSLRRTTFSESNLTEVVRTLGATVGETAAARDAARWPDNTPIEGSYAAEVDYKRYWVVTRAGWIDQQFVAPPTVASSGGSITFTAPAQAQLVYTLDGSDPRMQGGAIAPGAIVTNGPLTVAANANIHVRAYRADQKDVFPGSPWSSAVGSDQSSPLTPKARLINISSRAVVGSGANALIMGVTVADTEGKRYLSRGVGPGLVAFGASGVVSDPQLSIYGPTSAELFRNNGWETGIDASRIPGYSRAVGAFPLVSGSADSALASQIGSGGYTVQISTPSGRDGIGLAELYELDTQGRTVNLSTRAKVGTGDGVLIGGFVVSGPAYKRMLIRGVGPTLRAFGLDDALADPVLTVRSGETVVASNDRWQSGPATEAVPAASQAVGAFNLANASEDAALLITLP
ncbi:MAG TPA: CotH kinase family protein, partial [Opitutaceae bacterium]